MTKPTSATTTAVVIARRNLSAGVCPSCSSMLISSRRRSFTSASANCMSSTPCPALNTRRVWRARKIRCGISGNAAIPISGSHPELPRTIVSTAPNPNAKDHALYGTRIGSRLSTQSRSAGGSRRVGIVLSLNASAIASPLANRSAGSLRRTRSITAASCAGTPASRAIDGAGSETCLAMTTAAVLPSNGNRPVVARNPMMPSEYRSARPSTAPDDACSGAVDGRADLYSLGIIGFLATTGRLPFDGRTAAVVIAKQVSEPAPSMAREAGVPAQLAAVIERVLRKDPAARFANGEAMAEALSESAVAPRRLPPALRLWVDNRDPMRVPYSAWSFAFGLGAVLTIVRGNSGWLFLTGMAALPLIPHTIFRARQTRRVLSAGHGVEDMQLALAEVNERRREEMSIELHEGQTPALRFLRAVTTGVVIADVALIIGAQSVSRGLWKTLYLHHPIALRAGFAAAVLLPLTLIPVSMALGVPLLGRRFKNFNSGTLRERLW